MLTAHHREWIHMSDHASWLDESDPLVAAGMRNRRKVMGEEHVERSLTAADESPIKQRLQDVVTRLAWGGVWDRSGLDMKSRSLVTMSVLLAMGRGDEFVLHVRGALRNGWTPTELSEAIIHIGCYAGWPSAVQGLKLTEAVLSEAQVAGD
jgi:4-carboxymuconolactone decarboxylase